MDLIEREHAESTKLLDKFAQVRNAIHKVTRIFLTGDKSRLRLLQVLVADSEKRGKGEYFPFKILLSATHLNEQDLKVIARTQP